MRFVVSEAMVGTITLPLLFVRCEIPLVRVEHKVAHVHNEKVSCLSTLRLIYVHSDRMVSTMILARTFAGVV